MPEINLDIFIIAGESSGDSHSAQLINDIKKLRPDVKVAAIGGDKLRDAGAEIILDYREINFVGFTNIIANYFFLKKKFNLIRDYIRTKNPEILILCDFPGFNLRMAKTLRKYFKGKIIYYITPQVWAWNSKRIKTIKECIDINLVVFPFEKDFFDKFNIKSFYVGHPIINKIHDFLKYNNIKKNDIFTVSLMPGTRREEIINMLPVMNKISKTLTDVYGFKVNLICSGNSEMQIYSDYFDDPNANIIKPQKDSNLFAIAESDFVVTKFGTSNLEAGLIGTPFCAVYKSGLINYLIAKLLIKIKYVSLVNIIFNRMVVKEFIQKDFTIQNVVDEIMKIKDDSLYKDKMISDLNELWNYFNKEKSSAPDIISNALTGK